MILSPTVCDGTNNPGHDFWFDCTTSPSTEPEPTAIRDCAVISTSSLYAPASFKLSNEGRLIAAVTSWRSPKTWFALYYQRKPQAGSVTKPDSLIGLLFPRNMSSFFISNNPTIAQRQCTYLEAMYSCHMLTRTNSWDTPTTSVNLCMEPQ